MNQKNVKNVGVGVLDNPHFEGKTQKGITLIALVITIIVLLILAGVTINMVLGDDGIIGQAQGAEEVHKNAEEKQQYEINNAYKEILRTEKNISGIGNISDNDEETTLIIKTTNEDGELIEEEVTYTFGTAIENGVHSVKYNGNIDEVKANADIVKLNKKTYTDESISVGSRGSLVIDLNGYELIYTGTAGFVNSIGGELYIIDTSESKTGKIIMLEELSEENYNYQEKCDVNRDGVICSDDIQLVKNAFNKKETDPDWKQYANCDVNDSGQVTADDFGFINNNGIIYIHIINDYKNVYTDVKEGAFISQCIHNK